ncbi:transmembrane protein, putative (macronuclear) [Tetrahymena thermophila SB210]|uniref:Transmembrane protein, putative n=1 Tax=Tetrahymena thermophila (strain SB210) TaxID=312017 RepID=W7XG76_TETTS|nr:transmembrane protein, putative [Tetrahymena thermophila SB210]EWS71839.1 transmembrane protein, putative [Tetrahymena thermophila SB210]|eukprot:XP_012655632.1 transmembrane protein, putative [Tetrahymena thermophila SB210]
MQSQYFILFQIIYFFKELFNILYQFKTQINIDHQNVLQKAYLVFQSIHLCSQQYIYSHALSSFDLLLFYSNFLIISPIFSQHYSYLRFGILFLQFFWCHFYFTKLNQLLFYFFGIQVYPKQHLYFLHSYQSLVKYRYTLLFLKLKFISSITSIVQKFAHYLSDQLGSQIHLY